MEFVNGSSPSAPASWWGQAPRLKSQTTTSRILHLSKIPASLACLRRAFHPFARPFRPIPAKQISPNRWHLPGGSKTASGQMRKTQPRLFAGQGYTLLRSPFSPASYLFVKGKNLGGINGSQEMPFEGGWATDFSSFPQKLCCPFFESSTL